MPIVEDPDIIEPLSTTMMSIIDRPDHPLHSTSRQLWAAGWNQTITAELAGYLSRNKNFPDNFNYDVFKDDSIKEWTRRFPSDFDAVHSPTQAADVISRIQKNREERRILAEGGGAGLMIGLTTAIADPLPWLIPLGWVGKAGQAGQVAARATLALKMGTLLEDDAVRLGVRLLSTEERALAMGIPKTDVVAQETASLFGIGMRRADRLRAEAVAAEMAAEGKIASVRTVREAQVIEAETRKEVWEAMSPLEQANALRAGMARPPAEALELARTLEEGVRRGELQEALGTKYLARKDIAALTARLESLGDRKLAAEIAGRERLLAVQRSHESAVSKIAEHQKALEAAQKAASEGLPSPSLTALRLAGEGAAVGSLVSGGSEVIMQALQEGRERELLEHSFLAGGILGFALGGFGGALAGFSQRRLNQIHLAMVEDLTAGDIFSRLPDSAKLTPAEMRAAAAKGQVEAAIIDRVAAHSQPMADLLKRESSPMRRALRYMTMSPSGRMNYSISEHASQYSRSMFGSPYMPTEGLPIAVSAHARIVSHSQTGMLIATDLLRTSGKMDHRSFSDAVANVITSGEKHLEPAVNEAAEKLSRYFGDWDKKLISEGFYEKAELGVDTGYFPRVEIHGEVLRRRSEYIDVIAPYVGGKKVATEIADERLSHHGFYYDPLDFTGRTGHLKSRGLLNVPSQVLRDAGFLESDLLYVLERYGRQVGSQFEAVKLQPNGTIPERLNHTEWEQKIDGDFKALIANAKTPKQQARLVNEREATLRDFKFIRESLIGFLSRDPFESGARAVARGVTLTGSFMFLGNAGFRSVGDMVAPAFVNGAASYFRVSAARMRRNLKSLAEEIEPHELARAAWLYQWLGGEHSRSGLFFDFLNDGVKTPRGHGGIMRKAHNTWMILNLLRPVTAFSNEHAAYVGMDRLLRSSRKLADGVGLSKTERNNLILSGLDEATAARIGREVKAGGAVESEGALLPELSKWSDQELASTFRAAMVQNTRRGVLAPTKAELPILMHNPIGQVLLQFVSFPLGATQSFLISGLQRRDAAVVAGSMMMIGIGMFGVALDAAAKGREIPSLEDLAAEGFDRSGLAGVLSNFNHVTSQMTGGIVDINRLFGAKTIRERYGPLESVSDLVPGFSAIDEAFKEAKRGFRLLNGEEVTDKEIEAFSRRLPPFQGIQFSPVRDILESVLKEQQ